MDFKPYNIEDAKSSESSTFLFYGPAKSGKTDLIGSVGSSGLIINTGQGIDTLKSPSFKARQLKSGYGFPDVLDVIEKIDPSTGIFAKAEAFDMVTDMMDWGLSQPKYKTIIIDDATFLNRLARNKAIELNDMGNKSKSLDASRRVGMLIMAIQDFGTEMGIIEWFLGTYIPLFKQAGKHLVLTAHDRIIWNPPDKKSGEQTIKKVIPAFTGKSFPDNIAGFFDFVWHTGTVGAADQMKYRFETKGNELLTAGDRWGGVFDAIEYNLRFPDILARMEKAIAGGIKPTTGPVTVPV